MATSRPQILKYESLPLKHIVVQGNAYDRGFTYGAEAKKLIAKNIDFYIKFCTEYLKHDKASVLNAAQKLKAPIESFDNEMIPEMKGIADGAEVSLEEIIAVNARYELTKFSPECTATAILPEASSMNHTLIAQNWDLYPQVEDSCVMLEIRRKDRPNILTHTEAGVIGRMGMNSNGIGLVHNALRSSLDVFDYKEGLFHVLLRGILDSKTIGEGLEKAMNSKRAFSFNFLLGHVEGEAIDVEFSPRKFNHIQPEDGVIVHTNHFLNGTVGFEDNMSMPDSLLRYQRAKRLLKPKGIDCDRLKGVFMDHFNYPNSLCRHEDAGKPQYEHIKTCASIIMDLNEKKALITKGTPCNNSYREFVLS